MISLQYDNGLGTVQPWTGDNTTTDYRPYDNGLQTVRQWILDSQSILFELLLQYDAPPGS